VDTLLCILSIIKNVYEIFGKFIHQLSNQYFLQGGTELLIERKWNYGRSKDLRNSMILISETLGKRTQLGGLSNNPAYLRPKKKFS